MKTFILLTVFFFGVAQAADVVTQIQSAGARKFLVDSLSDRFCADVAAGFDQRRLTILLQSERVAHRPLLADINGDGTREKVWLDPTGSYPEIILRIEDAVSGKEITIGYPGDFEWRTGSDVSLVRIGDQPFVLTRTGNALHALFQLDAAFAYLPTCSFRQTGTGKAARNSALTMYEMLLERSKASHDGDPFEYVLARKNIGEMRLLVAHGHAIKGTGDAGKTGRSPLGRAVWTLDDDAVGRNFIAEMLQLGADPVMKDDIGIPLEIAVTHDKPGIATLLMKHSRDVSSLSSLLPYYIVERIKNKKAASTLLATYSRKRGEISWEAVNFILDQQDKKLLKILLRAGVPLSASEKYWRDGIAYSLAPYLADKLVHAGDEEMKALLVSLKRARPADGVAITLDAQYHTAEREYAVSTGSGMYPKPRYNQQLEQEFLNFSTSICMHLVGKNCGSPMLQSKATAWLARLSDTCPDAVRKTYDDTICKLAVYYAGQDGSTGWNFTIYMRNKLDPEDKLYFQESIRRLGTRSLIGSP